MGLFYFLDNGIFVLLLSTTSRDPMGREGRVKGLSEVEKNRKIAQRRLKLKYLLPKDNKTRLLPMNAAKMPRSFHLLSKLQPNGS